MIKKDIGTQAGAIWHCLSEKGKLSIREIGEITKYKDSIIMLSLGWLSREDKVLFSEKNGNVHVELNHNRSDMYY